MSEHTPPWTTAYRWQTITAVVVLAHGLLIYALHSGLSHALSQLTTPAQIISQIELITNNPAAAQPAPPPQPTPTPKVKPTQVPTKPVQAPKPVQRPILSVPAPQGEAAPPAATTAPKPEQASTTAATTSTSAEGNGQSKADTPAPPAIELPSTQAAYLNNPKPPYPPMSKRLNEQGKVVVRVLIGANGEPSNPQILTSSGYDRLDQTALETIKRWRFVPGKRAGVPEAMWFNVPMNFVLD